MEVVNERCFILGSLISCNKMKLARVLSHTINVKNFRQCEFSQGVSLTLN